MKLFQLPCSCSAVTKLLFCLFVYNDVACFSQIAFADHLNKMAKMDGINEKCTGLQKINWVDSLKGELVTRLNVYYI